MARDVIGVRVGLEDADEPDFAAFGLRQHGLGVVRRVDDDRDAGVLLADEGAGAAQIVVQELLEEHGATLPPASAMYPKAAPLGRRLPARAPRRAAASRTSRSRAGRRASARRSSGSHRGSGRGSETAPTVAARARRTRRTGGSRKCKRGRGTTS